MRITTVTGGRRAGRALTIHGTAAANHVVFVRGADPKNGQRSIGSATSASNGAWQLGVSHGFLYNTVVQARSGTQNSNRVHVNVHQVLRIKGDKFTGEGSNGFHYTLTGSSASHIPGEMITVLVKGKVVGKARMRSNGTYTVKFVVKQKSQALVLHGTGKSKSGVEYTLVGNRTFHV